MGGITIFFVSLCSDNDATLCFSFKHSYKEESEDGTDSDDVIEHNYDAGGEYVEDDRECIEKVLYSRLGRPGEIGAITTVYAPEYEEMKK